MKKKRKKENHKEITIYDNNDTTQWIDKDKPLTLEDLGFKLPDVPPTQVISIRLPTELVNQIRVLGSERDIPYQALIKLFLSEAVQKFKKKAS
jgi:predicted DNA binding CopG/RHH family protein